MELAQHVGGLGLRNNARPVVISNQVNLDNLLRRLSGTLRIM